MSTDDVTIPFDEYVIRRFRKDDIDALVRHANNRNVWLNLRDLFPHPYERQHAREWLETVRSMDPELAFAIAECAGAHRRHRTAPADGCFATKR